MSKPRITFESWTAMNDDIVALVERERKRMSVPWRIWEICVARANNWGHAAFRPGELPRLVCGGNTRSDSQTVNRGLKVLADMGRILEPADRGTIYAWGSTVLCVVVNREITQRQAGKGGRLHLCSEPEHRDHREETWPATKAEITEAEKPEHIPGANGRECGGCAALLRDGMEPAQIVRIHKQEVEDNV